MGYRAGVVSYDAQGKVEAGLVLPIIRNRDRGPHPASRATQDEERKVMTATDARLAISIAQPESYNHDLMESAASWLYTCQSKLGPSRNTAPPTDDQTAAFLAVAPWIDLQKLLTSIISRRTPTGASYGWYVAHAMRELYGEEL
jgi:hypothetical protein